MWQTKGLRDGVFGSVAMIGLTGEFLEVWQAKDLEEERWHGRTFERLENPSGMQNAHLNLE